LDPEGSNKDRENKAEMAATQSRRDEAKAEQEATRWKNAYNSTNEQINIMKKRYDHLCNVFNKGGI
jgi:DNA relaxase NicK